MTMKQRKTLETKGTGNKRNSPGERCKGVRGRKQGRKEIRRENGRKDGSKREREEEKNEGNEKVRKEGRIGEKE